MSFGGSSTLGVARFGVSAVDTRSRLLTETDSIEKTALDPYATYRTLYQQHRDSEVEAAHGDLPATVPAWYATPRAAPQPSPADTSLPIVAPRAPPPQ